MLFSFRCPKCTAELEADESAVGKFLDCPSCKESIQVLKPADAPPPAPHATPAQIPCAKAENLPHTPSPEQPFTQFPWAKGKVSGQTKAEGQKPLQVVVTDIRLRFSSVFILVLYWYISMVLIAIMLAALGLMVLLILSIVLAGNIHAPPGLFR